MPPVLRRNVLIFHAGGLGDFVLTWPLGIALGRLHPTSRIIFVTHPSKGELAAQAIGLDWRSIEAGWSSLHSQGAVLDEKCGQMLQAAHSIYTFMAADSDSWFANVSRISAQAKIFPLRLSPESGRHVSVSLLEQLSAAPAVRAAVEQILLSVNKIGLGKTRAGGRTIIVHPGSGGRDKCWPLDSYLRLIERLTSSKQLVKLVVGEVEMERFTGAQMRQLESAAPLSRPSTYVDLFNELASAGGFIGNDSGPGHLAGVIGLPSLILFGPSDPETWRPLGPRVKTLRNLILSDLTVDEVYLAAKEL
jgi:heptosyltransferase-3